MDSSCDIQSQNLALVTLKERCHFLKQQLKTVDEENIKLKVQIAQSKLHYDPLLARNYLVSDVERLKKEKDQLSNQVHILATENNNMWSRLSRLTVVNRNLTRRFTKLSDKLEKYGISSVSESESDSSENMHNKDYRKNLEEMSLRLINGIKLEKAELERQYEQMVELHKSDVMSSTDLAFSSIACDEDSILAGVRKHATKLTQIKHSLKQEQMLLLCAISELKLLKENEKKRNEHVTENEISDCTKNLDTVAVNSTQNSTVEIWQNSTHDILNNSQSSQVFCHNREDDSQAVGETVQAVAIRPTVEGTCNKMEQVCPMCGKDIPGNAEEFFNHVTEHFDDGDSPLNSFVHIP